MIHKTAAILLMNWKTSNPTKVLRKKIYLKKKFQQNKIKNGCNQRTIVPSRPVPNEAVSNYEFIIFVSKP